MSPSACLAMNGRSMALLVRSTLRSKAAHMLQGVPDEASAVAEVTVLTALNGHVQAGIKIAPPILRIVVDHMLAHYPNAGTPKRRTG